MSDPFFEVDVFKLRSQAEKVTLLLYKFLTFEGRVHLETTISAAAGLAGLRLLRDSSQDLSNFNPGELILSQTLNEELELHQQFLTSFGQVAGLDNSQGWAGPIPAKHQPLDSVLKLNNFFEPHFVELCESLNIDPSLWSRVALTTTVKLILKATGSLPPQVGQAIAWHSLQIASTHAPLWEDDDEASTPEPQSLQSDF